MSSEYIPHEKFKSAGRLPVPLFEELPAGTDPQSVFQALASLPHLIFFDSAQRHDKLGRYSYLAVDPGKWLTVEADGRPVLERLSEMLAPWQAERLLDLPPWQGGVAGLFGYEVGRSLEKLPQTKWDEFKIPALAVGLYDCVVAFDHQQGKAWAISQGLPETEPAARGQRAEERLQWLLDRIEGGEPRSESGTIQIPVAELAPGFPVSGHSALVSDFSREGYLQAVSETIELLRAGEAYQVNLSQRLLAPDHGDPVGLYLRLRRNNPAPFASYLDGGPWQIVSASPERFMQADERKIETRPIKGTRPRSQDQTLDTQLGQELASSEKDRAENVMIVDLLRNDLSRVCLYDSVEVPELFALEPYASVQHLVSVIQGELAPACDLVDLLRASLPGGSVTGAPKVRAQEIIAQFEPTARGAYCGAMAWIGLCDQQGNQAMDSSVLIRTITRAGGWLQLPAGGGVVVQSDPEQEYEETLHKAAGLIEALP